MDGASHRSNSSSSSSNDMGYSVMILAVIASVVIILTAMNSTAERMESSRYNRGARKAIRGGFFDGLVAGLAVAVIAIVILGVF